MIRDLIDSVRDDPDPWSRWFDIGATLYLGAMFAMVLFALGMAIFT